MKKRSKWMAGSLGAVLIGTMLASTANAEPVPLSAEGSRVDEVEMAKWEEQGYSKKDIHIATQLAKKAGITIEKVLSTYKESGSWQKAADKYGVSLPIRKLSHHHEAALLEHKEEILSYLSDYTGQSKDELQSLLDKGIGLNRLVHLAPLSKITGKRLDTLMAKNVSREKRHEFLKSEQIEEEDLRKERKRFREGLKKQIEKQ